MSEQAPPLSHESPTPVVDWEALARERGLATAIEELPPLREGFARGVHITYPEAVESILEHGLDYSRQGTLSSTARVWGDESEIQYTSEDHRFRNGLDIIFDLSFEETRLHDNEFQAPGLIPSDHIVGVVDPHKDERDPQTGQVRTNT